MRQPLLPCWFSCSGLADKGHEPVEVDTGLAAYLVSHRSTRTASHQSRASFQQSFQALPGHARRAVESCTRRQRCCLGLDAQERLASTEGSSCLWSERVKFAGPSPLRSAPFCSQQSSITPGMRASPPVVLSADALWQLVPTTTCRQDPLRTAPWNFGGLPVHIGSRDARQH
ncbi:unnamed protein product [Polarella glacialis]|uniref:Uncharacterized protein n=1 Tax=Polarella glacialis TaxID=89957 RepID=A0A813IZT5_POLGL|nr:unnamed protein product [Polarella glacialis]